MGEPEEDFGAQVREARKARGWTQETLARRLREEGGIDLSKTAIVRLEKGERPTRLNEVVALARVLEIPLGYAERPLRTAREYETAKENLDLAAELVQEAEQEEGEARARYLTRRREWLLLKAAILEYERRQADAEHR